MAKFKVTVYDEVVTCLSKIIEAENEDEARDIAYGECWDDSDGWEEEGCKTVMADIETIEEVKD